MSLHLLTVPRDQVVRAGRKQVLHVWPRRAHEWYAAGEGLEHPDRGNARQRLDVRPSRDVDSDAEAGEHLRRPVIRQPTSELNAGILEGVERMLRVTNAVNPRLEPQRLHWPKQELVQFRRPLLVAPIAHPHE